LSSDDPNDEPGTGETTRLGVIVLAAGRGTRMQSGLPKVLHPILGIPMLGHVLRAVNTLSACAIALVLDEHYPAIEALMPSGGVLAIQDMPLGTADAVAVGVRALSTNASHYLVLNGDVPLVSADDLRALVDTGISSGALLTMLTFNASGAERYGRVDRRDGVVVGIVEAPDDKRVAGETFEANGGVYLFDAAWLREHIGKVRVSASGEYYLTSLFALAARSSTGGEAIQTISVAPDNVVGVDDRVRLAEAEELMRRRVLTRLMRSGVTIVDPARTIIEPDVIVERDARIEPGSILRGDTRVGSGAVIGPYSVLENSSVGPKAVICHSWLTGAVVGEGVHVGPYSHLRPGTWIASGVHIGNFVETKAAEIGTGARVGHFSYLGDASVGANVNIGAGTITCNYDGERKHRTVIGDDVFVGCDTMLVAPVEIGDGGRTGAGAVVTKSVPPGKTVVGVPARVIGTSTDRTNPQWKDQDGR
jgi:bifunctional UDP-N-acetylglucosamine pyrophosphorylase/glucosamine-1-phosphate N-acetyltransferase